MFHSHVLLSASASACASTGTMLERPGVGIIII
jgi:hypothetical protein